MKVMSNRRERDRVIREHNTFKRRHSQYGALQ